MLLTRCVVPRQSLGYGVNVPVKVQPAGARVFRQAALYGDSRPGCSGPRECQHSRGGTSTWCESLLQPYQHQKKACTQHHSTPTGVNETCLQSWQHLQSQSLTVWHSYPLEPTSVAQGYMAAMDLGLEARYKDVRTS